MRIVRASISTACLLSCAALAQSIPTFADFPATEKFTGQGSIVQLKDADSRRYASVLRAAARRKPNFAGHYVLATWGCGASCLMSAAIDKRSGAVVWLPFTICCWDPAFSDPLEFKSDSRLLIVHGSRNEIGNGSYYYRFDGRQFVLSAEDGASTR